MPLSAHSQAVGIRNPEADAPPDLSHSKNNSKTSSLSVSLLCANTTLQKNVSYPDSLGILVVCLEERRLYEILLAKGQTLPKPTMKIVFYWISFLVIQNYIYKVMYLVNTLLQHTLEKLIIDICVKGPMSWAFLLIIIPLLRSTKINVYCAIFQTHIGFSYSIYTYSIV